MQHNLQGREIEMHTFFSSYAGPGSNLALNKFAVEWNTYFSSSKNVIIAQIDGRGTARKGNNILFANYRKLGTYEIEDQIYVARYKYISSTNYLCVDEVLPKIIKLSKIDQQYNAITN